MATELTAADLARLEHLAAYATAGPWEAWYSALNECWEAGQPCRTGLVAADCIDEDTAAFIAASREAMPALVAIVRELARALDASRSVDVDWRTEEEYCEYCRAAYHGEQTAHEPGCIIRRARALLGDSTTREG